MYLSSFVLFRPLSFSVFPGFFFFFFFNDTATTEIYTLSLHDALPISPDSACITTMGSPKFVTPVSGDRKSTRLNSSHQLISYAVFCLKKKQQTNMLSEVLDKSAKAMLSRLLMSAN